MACSRGIDPADRDDARVPGQRGIRIFSEIQTGLGIEEVYQRSILSGARAGLQPIPSGQIEGHLRGGLSVSRATAWTKAGASGGRPCSPMATGGSAIGEAARLSALN
jgi:hypothetical protein